MVRRTGEVGTAPTAVLEGQDAAPARVLVAHAGMRTTLGGVLRHVGEAMRAQGLEVDVVPARSVRDVGAYDAVVVGSAVVRRRWHRHARRFVRRHAEALADRPVWLFSCVESPGHGRRPGRVRGVRRALARLEARGHEVFDPAEVAAVSPFVARSAPVSTGDGAPDTTAVDTWGARVGGSIAWEHHVRRAVIQGTV